MHIKAYNFKTYYLALNYGWFLIKFDAELSAASAMGYYTVHNENGTVTILSGCMSIVKGDTVTVTLDGNDNLEYGSTADVIIQAGNVTDITGTPDTNAAATIAITKWYVE